MIHLDYRESSACKGVRGAPAQTGVDLKTDDLDRLIREHRVCVEQDLKPLIERHYPSMVSGQGLEYRKMLELSTKMTMVGRACTLIAGHEFDARRLRISGLFGGCCFLGDSFLDDFGDEAARDYLQRYERLIEKGWFEIRNDREQLFYVVLTRLFSERDVLDVMLRQAVVGLFLTQKRDVELRRSLPEAGSIPRRRQLRLLRECARDRSGHAITLLTLFLVPRVPLQYHRHIYSAGSLIMNIDDHGDCHYDLYHNRLTYMNQVKHPARVLTRIFHRTIERIREGLPESSGRELLIAFMHRYFSTRLQKHRLEQSRGALSWTVYE